MHHRQCLGKLRIWPNAEYRTTHPVLHTADIRSQLLVSDRASHIWPPSEAFERSHATRDPIPFATSIASRAVAIVQASHRQKTASPPTRCTVRHDVATS